MKKPDVGKVFQALADPTRRKLLEKISAGPISVSRLAEPLKISLAAVVQHLQVLEECGLVKTQKTGRIRTCNIEMQGFAIIEKWIHDRRTIWDRRLDNLGNLLGGG